MTETERYMFLADKLAKTQDLSDEEFLEVITCPDTDLSEILAERARSVREKYYGKDVYLRGLIEYSNICKNNCYCYCKTYQPLFSRMTKTE